MTLRNCTKLLVSAGVMTLIVESALAQQPVVQPAQSQSAEQMQQDLADCQTIAGQSTGATPTQAPAQPQGGGRVRGAAKGALAGAAGAEVRGQQYGAYDKLSDDVKQEYRQE